MLLFISVMAENIFIKYPFSYRSFALKVGLQMLLREYDFDNKNKVTFSGSDIMNIFPVVKHINPRVSFIIDKKFT